jgi:putative ABC transport system permease protein
MHIGHDLQAALRQLLRRPLASAAAAAVLALGVGSSVALFSVVDAVLLRPLPYPSAERLVALWEARPEAGISRSRVSGFTYLRWRDEARSFDGLALLGSDAGALRGFGEPIEARGFRVTCNVPALLGLRAQRGRMLDASDCAADAAGVVVISDALWRHRFGADPTLIGRALTLAGEAVVVVGVLPPGLLPTDLEGGGRFRFADDEERYWRPFREVRPNHGHVFGVLGRLGSGVGLESARSEMAVIAERLERAHPETHSGFRVRVESAVTEVTGAARQPLTALLCGALLLLAIACASVAQSQLTRVLDREQASAVRAALGASRMQLMRPFVLEAVLLSLAGGALGTAAAQAALRGIALLPLDLPRLASARVDLRSLIVALALVLAAGASTGLLAGSRAGAAGIAGSLRGRYAQPAASRLRRALLATQAALAVVLVAGAALLGTSLNQLAAVDAGFEAGELLIVDLNHGADRYRERTQLVGFYDALLERLAALPGVRAVGASYDPPLRSNWYQGFNIVGEPAPADGHSPGALFRTVTPGYFEAAGVSILEGRGLDRGDDAGAPGAAIVNRALAHRYFPGRSPLGRQLSLTTTQWLWGEGLPRVFAIVGIAEDERIAGLALEPEPAFYLPYPQTPQHQMSVLVRSAGNASALVAPVTRVIHEVDRGQPLAAVTTIRSVLATALARPRLSAVLAVNFGIAALALAALGLSAALAESIARRRVEFGVRLALGSTPRHLFRLAIVEGMRPALLGALAGAAGALACGQLLASQLYGVKPWDPALHAVSCAVVLTIGLAACAAPARRAARTDPAAALRQWS